MKPKIIDLRTKTKADNCIYREIGRIKGVMIHRCGVNKFDNIVIGYNASVICDAFTGKTHKWRNVARKTGKTIPYTFLIGGDQGPKRFDGKIWQCLSLEETGWHAKGASIDFIGIGLIFDGRFDEPSKKQYASLTKLITWLVEEQRLPSVVYGHGEVADAHDGSKAPGRINACPGDKLNMNILRETF